MATAAMAVPGLRVRRRTSSRPRTRWPVENLILFAVATALYMGAANYLVFHLHYMNGDAYARVDNAFDVLFTADPHLGAIGFFWPPLPSFLMLPILAFKPIWPALATQGFAGSIEAALFSAGSVVLFNSGLRWAGVVRPMRWLFCVIWAINPMNLIYSGQGMSEAMFVFFFIGAILVFLCWSESRRSALLPLMGVLAGLGCLCRNESFVLAFFIGVGVIALCVRDRASWRQIETEFVLYALPTVFVTLLWIGSQAIILHDPLSWIHANGLSSPLDIAQTPAHGVSSGQTQSNPFSAISFDSYSQSANYVITRSLALFPAVLVFLALLGARLLVQARRLPGILLIIFGICIPLIDMRLLRSGLGPYLRYQIAIIPFTFLMGVYVLRSIRGRRILSTLVGMGMAAALLVSTTVTLQTVSNPSLAPQEAPVITAIQNNQRVTADYSPMDVGIQLSAQILALDKDHGRILCDSRTCFPIILNVPDTKQFVVTSDRNFEDAASQPLVYGVKYFLVAADVGLGTTDRLNALYPTLFDTGGGFSTLVGEAGGFRLYRITGPTGRG